jgi:hypothetical protein
MRQLARELLTHNGTGTSGRGIAAGSVLATLKTEARGLNPTTRDHSRSLPQFGIDTVMRIIVSMPSNHVSAFSV